MRQFRLQLAETMLTLLEFCWLANDTCKQNLFRRFASPTASSIGKVVPSLPTDNDPACANDPPLSRFRVACQIAIVLQPVCCRMSTLTFFPITSPARTRKHAQPLC